MQQEAEYSFWGFIPTKKQTNKTEDGAARRSSWWISGSPARCQRTSNIHSARQRDNVVYWKTNRKIINVLQCTTQHDTMFGAKDAAAVVEEDVD